MLASEGTLAVITLNCGHRPTARHCPVSSMLAAELERTLEIRVRATLTERILVEGGLEGRVAAVLGALKHPKGTTLAKGIGRMFQRSPQREWRAHIAAVVAELDKKV